jgi:hypothetical protein
MGWSVGYDSKWQRDIGYGVLAFCDEPGCNEVINRGLAYVCCGEEPYGGDKGCGLYFCQQHQKTSYPLDGDGEEDEVEDPICGHGNFAEEYTAKPDHPDWIHHKLTDETWQKWRDENPKQVVILSAAEGRKQ